jgi:hypothetical protein
MMATVAPAAKQGADAAAVLAGAQNNPGGANCSSGWVSADFNQGKRHDMIAGEQYYVFPGTTLTVCCLTLLNGFTVTGESAAASPENFDVEIGRKIARDNARGQIWAFEGYLLQRLYRG